MAEIGQPENLRTRAGGGRHIFDEAGEIGTTLVSLRNLLILLGVVTAIVGVGVIWASNR